MKKIRIICIFLGIWFLIHIFVIISDGLINEYSDIVDSKIIVIFGNKINQDGSLSERLKSRLDVGINLWESRKIYNDIEKIIVSGGLGKEGFYEAEKMADYLVKRGVLKEKIIIDNYGMNTLSTAKNSQQYIKDYHSIIVVSQYFHISRVKLAFRKVGFANKVYGVSSNYFELRDVYSIAREFPAYYKYLFFY